MQHLLALPGGPVSLAALASLTLIYVTAAVFSGLSGFGFSAIGSLSLLVLPPQLGISMLMGLSLVTQASSLGSLWHDLRGHLGSWKRPDGVGPYLAGGTCGMPLGLKVLSTFGGRELTLALGGLLVAYSIWSLMKPASLRLRAGAPNPLRSFLIGALGGVVGGFSAFPGSVIVVWNGLVGTGKEAGRALAQPFILWMQAVGLGMLLANRPQLFGHPFWLLFMLAAPLALLGNALGVAIYRRTGDVGYRRITFAALGITGLGLMAKMMMA